MTFKIYDMMKKMMLVLMKKMKKKKKRFFHLLHWQFGCRLPWTQEIFRSELTSHQLTVRFEFIATVFLICSISAMQTV
jgi:hypothetical protein